MRKDGTIDIEEELKIIRNNLIETLPKSKEMFVIHNTNRIEKVEQWVGQKYAKWKGYPIIVLGVENNYT